MREAKNIRLIESLLKDGDLVLKSYLLKILSVLAMTVEPLSHMRVSKTLLQTVVKLFREAAQSKNSDGIEASLGFLVYVLNEPLVIESVLERDFIRELLRIL
jgi:hypothetical protein